MVQALESRVLLSAGSSALLLKQINLAKRDANPSDFVVSGGELYFVADDGIPPKLVWKSDGTAPGTAVISNSADGGTLRDLTDINGTLYYFNDVGIPRSGGTESVLMRSDGTPAGTTAVSTFGDAGSLTNVNGTAYFIALAPTDQRAPIELYKTDGTAAGTVPVAPVTSAVGATGFTAEAGPAASFEGDVYFMVGDRLWKSDGTPGGTVQVATVGTPASNATILSANGRLFIVNSDSLWVSDGTAAGTSLVKAFDFPIGGVVAFQQDVYFSAADSNQQMGIWKTNGTAAGTLLVSYVPAASPQSPAAALAVLNNVLYFDLGTALWRTDGSSEGTVDASTIFGPGVTFSSYGAIYNGKFYFNGAAGVLGHQLWATDGTPGGTSQVAQVNATPVSPDLFSGNAVTIGKETYFSAGDAGVWQTDGTATGTVQLSSASVIGDLVNAGGTLYFISDTDQLWKSDGTPAGTVTVAQLPTVHVPAGQPVPNATLTVAGNEVYFYAGQNLYRSDGTAAGTVALAPAVTGPSAFLDLVAYPANVYSMADVNGTLFFAATVGDNMELDKIDPARGAAVRVMTFKGPAPQASELTAVDGKLYFIANDGIHGPALWEDTPTTAPAMVYAPKGESTADKAGTVLYEFNHALYFSEPALGPGLFTVDPNTRHVARVSNETAINMIGVGDQLYFQVASGAAPTDAPTLWETDGRSGRGDNATQVAGATIQPGRAFAVTSRLTPQWLAANGLLYFIGQPQLSRGQLWQASGTDATPADPTEPASGWTAENLLAQTSNGLIFFGSNDPQQPAQLWEFPVQAPPPAPPAPPTPPSALVPALGRVNLAPQATSGSTFNARIPVVVTNRGIALKGNMTVNLYAEMGTTLDGTQMLVASKTRRVTLRTNQRAAFRFSLKSLPASLQAGGYHLIAQVVDPAGDTNTTATSQAVQVSARSAQSSIALGPITPATLAADRRGSAVVTVSNQGNAPAFVGRITVVLPGAGVNATDVTLTSAYEGIDVPVGKSRRFRLAFKFSAATAGHYVPTATVSLDVLATVTSDSPLTVT